MEIIPAILPKNFAEIEEKVSLIVGLSKFVQIDICDGKFVPNATWPYVKHDENFEQILREEKGMPQWEKVNYEFDLMIDNPNEDDARKWLSAGAEKIILHIDSSKDLNPVIDVLHGLVEIGLAISQNTNIKDLEKYISKIQYLQVMGIKKVGFQGQRFENKTIELIKEIKSNYKLPVQVDGGVNLDSAVLLKEAGVERIVVGSALFGTDNIVDTYHEFKSI